MTSNIFQQLAEEESGNGNIFSRLAQEEKPSKAENLSKSLRLFGYQPSIETTEKIVEPIEKLKSVLSAFPKGAIKEFGETLLKEGDPVGLILQSLGIPSVSGNLLQQQENLLNQLIPTEEGKSERISEEAGRYSLAGTRGILMGLSGQAAEEAGAPPWLRLLTEIGVGGAPKFGKKIVPTKAQKPLVEVARKHGLTEKEIAPSIQSEFKRKSLGRLVPKSEGSAQKVKESKKAIGKIYENLRNLPESKKPISSEIFDSFEENASKIMKDIPNELRNKIKTDYHDLIYGEFNIDNLINFYKDIGQQAIKKGNQSLFRFQEPVMKAIEEVSPKIAHEFSLGNQLYAQNANLRKTIKPSLYSNLMKLGRVGRILVGLYTGSMSILTEAVGEQGAKLLAKQMIFNPRFQNLTKQMVQATKNKNPAKFQRLSKYLEKNSGISFEEKSKNHSKKENK